MSHTPSTFRPRLTLVDTPSQPRANGPIVPVTMSDHIVTSQGDGMDIPLNTESLRLLEEHLTWMRRRRLADSSLVTRRGHVIRFLKFAAELGRTLLDADYELIDAYQATLTTGGGALNERNALSSLRNFYGWALCEEKLAKDPTVRVILPRCVRRRPRPIREDRLFLAWQNGDNIMRAIIALAAMTGLRAIEIARLSWSDVDFHGEMVIVGKGGHERVIWIADCQPLIDALTAIRTGRRGPVIPRRDGKPGHYKANTLDKWVNDFLHDLGIEETLHQLRHRFGTIGYRACTDPIAIMRLMGHADLSATVIYADSASESAETALEATSHIGLAS